VGSDYWVIALVLAICAAVVTAAAAVAGEESD